MTKKGIMQISVLICHTLAAVLAIFISRTEASEEVDFVVVLDFRTLIFDSVLLLKRILCIHYLMRFKKN